MSLTGSRTGPVAGPENDGDEALVAVIDLVRRGAARTRPEISRISGLGRSIVTQRVEQAIELGLVEDAALGPSTGGRAPRRLRFRAERGVLLAAVFGARHVGVALTDLDGVPVAALHDAWDVAAGPEASLAFVAKAFDGFLAQAPGPVWGVVIGVPGPVEFGTGRPVAPPIMPGWDGFDIRDRLQSRYGAPCWVDNDVNLMALGEHTAYVSGSPAGSAGSPVVARPDGPAGDMLFVKIGSGIGAGLISGGRVHRGANGSAGDVGHIAITSRPEIVCRCGQVGCLEAVAGGWALARDGEVAAREGRSRFLAERLAEHGSVAPADVADGARRGDPVCVELVSTSGRIVGETLATLVNFFNPAVVAVGGTIADTGDLFLAAVRQTVYRRSLPLATRDLRIVAASTTHAEGVAGAAALAVEQLFAHGAMLRWLGRGSPVLAAAG